MVVSDFYCIIVVQQNDKIMNKERVNEITNQIANSKFIERYAMKDTWLSGCTTEVYPISAWMPSCTHDGSIRIEIQLDCFKGLRGINKALDKLVREIGEELVLKHYISKYDGSCPNVAKIFLKP